MGGGANTSMFAFAAVACSLLAGLLCMHCSEYSEAKTSVKSGLGHLLV